MIKPALQDDAFLVDVAQSRGQPGFRLWWLGQSGFLLQWEERHLLFDPYLSDSLTSKYSETDKPHVRMTERVIEPERLDFIDVVTSSHQHTDHLDPQTLQSLAEANPTIEFVAVEAHRELSADRAGMPADQIVGMDVGRSEMVEGFEITAVPAAHEGLDKDNKGCHLYLGYIVQFENWTVYHSGDTVMYPGIVNNLRAWSIDVALLPINGSRPERRVPGNLWGTEAAQLARDIGAGVVVPCHYEMFEFNTVTPDEFIEVAESIGQPYVVMKAGSRLDIPPASN